MANSVQIDDSSADIPETSNEQRKELERIYNLPSPEEKQSRDELEALKQRQRRDGLQKTPDVGSNATNLARPQDSLANQLGARAGTLGRQAANQWGQNQIANKGAEGAGKLANRAAQMGSGGEAAIANAVSGALKGEGVTNVAKSAVSWYILWFAFGFLTLGVITSPTVVGLIAAIIALVYLDFHFIMSQFGSRLFVPMNWPQKGTLLFANLIVAILPLMFISLTYAFACGSNFSYYGSKIIHYGSLGFVEDICSMSSDSTFSGGRSGGAGATGTFGEIDIVLTSAYRPGAIVFNTNRLSAHGRGEAFDIALRNPRVGIRQNPRDPRINQLISIGESLMRGRGDVLDEYSNPQCNLSSQSCAGHIHVEFNPGQCDGTGQPLQGAPTDLVDLTGMVPISGASNPRVRACMEAIVLNFFEMAGQTKVSEQTPGVETEGD